MVTLGFSDKCRIISEHSDWVAIEKGVGVLSHPNTEDPSSDALMFAPYDFSKECYVLEGKKLFLVHRLDAATSGILLLAKTEAFAKKMGQLFRENKVSKTYYAWVKGFLKQKKGSWSQPLKRLEGQSLRMVVGKGVSAKTLFFLERTFRSKCGTLSLLRLEPHTGRTHQLRVHCAYNDLPIVGDGVYGDFRFNKQFLAAYKKERLFLHAQRLEIKDLGICVEAQLPEEFFLES